MPLEPTCIELIEFVNTGAIGCGGAVG